jgi:DNA-binding NarL/FixJ family response regulator
MSRLVDDKQTPRVKSVWFFAPRALLWRFFSPHSVRRLGGRRRHAARSFHNDLASFRIQGKTPAPRGDTAAMGKSNVIRVGIVEDHRIFLELLSATLGSLPGIDVTAAAHSVAEAKKWFRPEELDVLLLDIELPDGNGVGLGVQMRTAHPHLAIVLLSDLDMLELILGLPPQIRSGFSYLTKGATQSVETLANVIRLASEGEVVIDPTLADRSRARPGTALARLTTRQFEVLRCVARGESNQGIAQMLGITVNSVGNHLIGIYDTLRIAEGSNSRVAAVLKFLEETSPAAGYARSLS